MPVHLLFADISWQGRLVWPGWMVFLVLGVLLAGVIVCAIAVWRSGAGARWAGGLSALRLAAWLLFALILLQPLFSYSRSVKPRAELIVLVDTSASMKHASGEGSRLDEARRHLEKGNFASALRRDFEPRWFRFDKTATSIDEEDLPGLAAAGGGTNVGQSLATVCQLLHAQDKKAERVLLVSDGNGVGFVEAVEAARRFGVKIDVLAPSDSGKAVPPRVEIAEVQGSRRVLLGSETHFRVTLRNTLPEETSLLLMLREDGKTITEAPLTLKPSQGESVHILSHRPQSIGTKQYEFQLLAKGETEPRSKKETLAQVVDSKYEILVMEDTWRWEYKYLHRLFEDDPSFRFTALLARGKSFAQFGSPDRRVDLIGMPQGRAELEGFDLFFLGDVNPTRWPGALAPALANLVAVEGKSLVVIGGPHLASWLDQPELHALLPVDLSRESGTPTVGPIEARLRSDAAGSPFFFQLPAGAEGLPALDQVYPALRKRPGATVLLEASKHRNAYGPLILMAEHTVGRGRVLFVATDTLWKWHTLAGNEGPTPYQIFWQQALRALTPQRSQVGSFNLWLTPSRSTCVEGETVTVEAEAQSERALVAGRVEATATFGDGTNATLVFAQDPAAPRIYRATFAPTAAGPAQVTASLVSDNKRVAEAQITLHVDANLGEEELPVDRALLARLASATGGRVVDPARPESWPTPPESTDEAPKPRTVTIDLWRDWWLLLMLCGVLGADWFLRLRKGLT